MITGEQTRASNTGRMSLSVPADKQAKLDAIAANAKRSWSCIVNEAIDHYLDLYEWQTRRIEEAGENPKRRCRMDAAQCGL